MTRGYLLDTNIVAYWFAADSLEHPRVMDHIQSLPVDSLLFVSAITLGEIEYGHQSETKGNYITVQMLFNEFVQKKFPKVLEIGNGTATDYGRLRALLFEKFGGMKGKKRRWPEELTDPSTAKSLGIQENDLWIAAQAMEHRLVLVTHDKMTRIREVACPLLDVEDWTEKG